MTDHQDNSPRHVRPLTVPFDLAMDLPGSKSVTLRDVMLAALADGTSEIHAPGECDDFWRMEAALSELGVEITRNGGRSIHVRGGGGRFAPGHRELDCGMSAASARFLLAARLLIRAPCRSNERRMKRRSSRGAAISETGIRRFARIICTGNGPSPRTVQPPATKM